MSKFPHKPSSTTAVTQTDELPMTIELPPLQGRSATAFPDLEQWTVQLHFALNQWWDSASNVIQKRLDDLLNPVNNSTQSATSAATSIASINSQLVAIQNAINAIGSTAALLTQVAQLQAFMQSFTALGKTLAASADTATAKVALGLRPGNAIAPVADATALALTGSVGAPDTDIEDVSAAFSQAILNDNFADVAGQINALIVDVADLRAKFNQLIPTLKDQNLIAKL